MERGVRIMGFDNTVPNADNYGLDDISAMQENFELLESAQVVDEGSTSDGEYIRFENGLQICWGYQLGEIDTSTAAWQHISHFPASFDDIVFMALSPLRDSDGHTAVIELAYSCSFDYTYSHDRWRISYRGSDNGILTDTAPLAIGRWK